jgi:RND family efflux transporter MFP subunit
MTHGHQKRIRASRVVWLLTAALSLLVTAGCTKKAPPEAAPKPLEVNVSEVIAKPVDITREYQATITAVKTVDIYARVQGYLNKRYFKEGTIVKKGQLLYQIEPDEWQNQVDSGKASLAQAKANLTYANQEARRYTTLYKQNAVSQEIYQQKVSAAKAASADVANAKAQLANAQLNLDYTHVTSPITGRIGNTQIDVGNLVSAGPDKTKLATVVQIDPIYIYFNPEASSLTSFLNLVDPTAAADAAAQVNAPVKDGKAVPLVPEKAGAAVEGRDGPVKIINTQAGATYPYTGVIDFVNNQVDQTTNAITVRAVIANPGGALVSGSRLRVQVHVANLDNATVIPQSSIQTTQQVQATYVLQPDDTLKYSVLKLGPTDGPYRVVETGVNPGQKVAVSNLNMLSNGMKVTPTVVAAPGTDGTPEDGAVPPPVVAPPVKP